MSLDRKILNDFDQSTTEQFEYEIKELQKSLLNIPAIRLELDRRRNNPSTHQAIDSPEGYQELFDIDSKNLAEAEAENLLSQLRETNKSPAEIKDSESWKLKDKQYLDNLEKNIRSIVNDYAGSKIASDNQFNSALDNSIYRFIDNCKRIQSGYHYKVWEYLDRVQFSQYLNGLKNEQTNLLGLINPAREAIVELQKLEFKKEPKYEALEKELVSLKKFLGELKLAITTHDKNFNFLPEGRPLHLSITRLTGHPDDDPYSINDFRNNEIVFTHLQSVVRTLKELHEARRTLIINFDRTFNPQDTANIIYADPAPITNEAESSSKVTADNPTNSEPKKRRNTVSDIKHSPTLFTNKKDDVAPTKSPTVDPSQKEPVSPSKKDT